LDPNNKYALTGLARLKPAAPVPPPEPVPPPKLEPSSPRTGSKYVRLKPKLAAQAQQSSPAENLLAVKQTPPERSAPGCPFCRRPISAIDKNCPHCRLPLVMRCPGCGTDVDVEEGVCLECRQPLGNYRQRLTYFAGLGTAYLENQQYQEAVTAWQAVETVKPDYPQLHLHLGKAHLGADRPDRAWNSLQQALKENPKAAGVHFALGELSRQRGEREQAFNYYLTATQLDPQSGLAWFQLARIYRQARLPKEAIQAYRRAIKLLPPDSAEHRQIEEQLGQLNPGLPDRMATGWPELIRQMTGPVVLCLLAALLDSGLRPWWIPLSGWLALLLAISGAGLYVSGAELPRNPLIRLLAGERGLSSTELKISLAFVGAILWFLGMLLILLPLGQSYPEPPQL
jgi:tetratricopeptide (TPR) repeat protein